MTLLPKNMEHLSKDVKSLIFPYLTLESKRTLLQVSKKMYLWIKPYIRKTSELLSEKTDSLFKPNVCLRCLPPYDYYNIFHVNERDYAKSKSKRTVYLDHTFIHCEYGHKSLLCRNFEKKVIDGEICPRFKCGHKLIVNQQSKISNKGTSN